MTRDEVEFQEQRGQTMAEYVVVLGVITLAIVTSFAAMSGAVQNAFERTLALLSTIA
jgi:Flp pilus assembly pilin Flp